MVATTLLLARHGETDWNRERRWQGHADPPLNETGRQQARTLAADAAGVEAVYASDLARARETAEIVAAALGVPLQLDPRLREADVEDLTGRSVTEVIGDWPRPLDFVLAERPELFDAMRGRVVAALEEIAAAHDGGRVLVVTHGGPIAAAWFACGGTDEARPTVGNCHVHPIRVEGSRMAGID